MRIDKKNQTIFIYTLLVLFNIVSVGTNLSYLFSIPQLCIVLYQLLKGDLKKATFYNLLFFMTSISTNMMAASNLIDNTMAASNYTYGNLRFLGPIRWTYAVSIIILVTLLFQKKKMCRGIFLFKIYQSLLRLAVIAFSFGVVGILFDDNYSFDSFYSYLIYIFILLVNLAVILLQHDRAVVEVYYHHSVYVLQAVVFGTLLSFLFFNTQSFYGGMESIFTPDILGLGPLLLISIFYCKCDLMLVVSLISFFYISTISLGGKGVFTVASIVLIFAYLLFFYFDSSKIKYIKRLRIITLFSVFVISSLSLTFGDLVIAKTYQALSIFSGDISTIANSPAIRIAETLNIFDSSSSNPITLLFGKGYGGYYTDSLGLFSILDISHDAFSDQEISSGVFTTAHDTFATVPLFHGIYGLFIIFSICFNGIKKVRENFLYATIIPWIVFMFYFSTLFAAAGVFFMYGAEFRPIKNYIDRKENEE